MKQVVLIGGGSSVKEGLEKGLWDKLQGKEVWSLNFAYKLMPYNPNRILWVDRKVFVDNCKELQLLYHKGVDLHCRNNPLYSKYDIIKTYNVQRKRDKFDANSNLIFIGHLGLVGIFSLSLAIKENYDRIFLLGYDFGSTSIEDKNTHWYQDQVQEKNIKSGGVGNPSVYMVNNKNVKPSVADFDVYKPWSDKIFNVSSKTNIHQFNIISYDEFFNKLGEV